MDQHWAAERMVHQGSKPEWSLLWALTTVLQPGNPAWHFVFMAVLADSGHICPEELSSQQLQQESALAAFLPALPARLFAAS